MKDFLYLVQTRAKNVPVHLALESRRADVLIHTFDAAVNNPNCIYKKNTSWASGRNLLVEAARKKKKRYRYYVLLDDDVAFAKGGFAEFEDEVLKIKPDFCTPVHRSKLAARWLANLTPFRYSTFIDFDCCCVCLSEKLLQEDKLLPYHLDTKGIPHEKIYYSSWRFWFDLFENYPRHRLLMLNKIQIRNRLSKYPWQFGAPEVIDLYKTLKVKESKINSADPAEAALYKRPLVFISGKNLSNMAKAMPYSFILVEGPPTRTMAQNKISKLRQALAQSDPGIGAMKTKVILKVLLIYVHRLEKHFPEVALIPLAMLTLLRDVKLNCRLWFERNKQK